MNHQKIGVSKKWLVKFKKKQQHVTSGAHKIQLVLFRSSILNMTPKEYMNS